MPITKFAASDVEIYVGHFNCQNETRSNPMVLCECKPFVVSAVLGCIEFYSGYVRVLGHLSLGSGIKSGTLLQLLSDSRLEKIAVLGGTPFSGLPILIDHFIANADLNSDEPIQKIFKNAGHFILNCSLPLKRYIFLHPKHIYSKSINSLGSEILSQLSGAFGTSIIGHLSHGLGIYFQNGVLFTLSHPSSLSVLSKNCIGRGNNVLSLNALLIPLPDVVQKSFEIVNDLTEPFKQMQKHQNSLSDEVITMALKLLQAIDKTDNVRKNQKVTLFIGTSESRFESVPVEIFIDGRPI